jgi:hypothetical protein
MTYKNSNFLYLVLIIILLCVLYLCKTNENESYKNESYKNESCIIKTKNIQCLTEEDYYNIEKNINYLEEIYHNINDKNEIIIKDNDIYDIHLQNFIDNLLSLFEKLMSIPISCILNNKNQLDILDRILKLLDKNKDKLRSIKINLMNKFNNNIRNADILRSKKSLKVDTLNSFSNLFNTISYIFNDNYNYCDFMCKCNKQYKNSLLHVEPQHTHIKSFFSIKPSNSDTLNKL